MSEVEAKEHVRAAFDVETTSVWTTPWLGYLVTMMVAAAIFQGGIMDVGLAVIGLPLAFATGWVSRRGATLTAVAWILLGAAGFTAGALGI